MSMDDIISLLQSQLRLTDESSGFDFEPPPGTALVETSSKNCSIEENIKLFSAEHSLFSEVTSGSVFYNVPILPNSPVEENNEGDNKENNEAFDETYNGHAMSYFLLPNEINEANNEAYNGHAMPYFSLSSGNNEIDNEAGNGYAVPYFLFSKGPPSSFELDLCEEMDWELTEECEADFYPEYMDWVYSYK